MFFKQFFFILLLSIVRLQPQHHKPVPQFDESSLSITEAHICGKLTSGRHAEWGSFCRKITTSVRTNAGCSDNCRRPDSPRLERNV